LQQGITLECLAPICDRLHRYIAGEISMSDRPFIVGVCVVVGIFMGAVCQGKGSGKAQCGWPDLLEAHGRLN
jgi:hypothetical protein